MPIIMQGNENTTPSGPLSSQDYGYKYQRGVNLMPKSPAHELLRDMLMQRIAYSHRAMSGRYDGWREVDQTLTSYIYTSDEERVIKAKDPRKPISIVVPVSQANLDIILTYMVLAFLDDPIFRYEGAGEEDVLGAMLMERLIATQCRRAKVGIQLHTHFRDAFAYGMGIVTPSWVRRLGKRTNRVSGIREQVVKFEGNELSNIDPYRYFPDPNYAVQDVQRSEFCGWLISESEMSALSREAESPDVFFNAQYLKHISGRSRYGSDNSDRDKYSVKPSSGESYVTHTIDTIFLYATIIPKVWGLGKHEYPEKWMFGIAGDEIIICAQPLEDDHEMYPVGVCAPDYDGYSVTPLSRVETLYGLQTMTNFLYNSHIENVRKAINDMFVYDPTMVNANDLLSPKPGKAIRTRKAFWGRGTQGAVEQLKVVDVTAGHLGEAAHINGMIAQISGASDPLSGQFRKGSERVSAEESRSTKNAALSRLERVARVISMQSMYDLAYIFASNNQQYLSTEQYIAIAGPYEDALRIELNRQAGSRVDDRRIAISPEDFNINFDVIIGDGTLPTSGDPTLWASMFQMIGSNQMLMQQFDVSRIFKYWARLSGAKNLNDFIQNVNVQPQVMENEEALKQRDAGNIIPMNQAMGGGM